MENHVFTGVFIPAKIWINPNICPTEKLILGEIDVLSRNSGWCFAKNAHFAKWLGCKPNNVSNFLTKMASEGKIVLKYSNDKTHEGRKMKVNLQWYHGLPEYKPGETKDAKRPHTQDVPPHTQDVPPHTQDVPPHTQDVTEREFKLTSKHTKRGDTPTPQTSTSKQKPKSVEVAPPGENPESLKAEVPPSKKVTPKKVSPAGNYEPSNFDIYGVQPLEIMEGETFAEMEDRLGRQTNRTFEVTAIASPTSIPGVTLVEAAPKTQPLPRVSTTIEAETKISEWIAGEGIETVKSRYNIAMQPFDPDNAAAIAAHYCSCFTKNQANKERLLKDPITHFSDGLFSYLKNEQVWGRNNAPKEGGQTRQNGQPHSALPRSLQNQVGK